jgi:hypothetical protein
VQVPGSENDEDTPNAGPSLFGAVLKKPDIEAARQRLSRDTGIPPDAIRARPQDAERQAKLQTINPTQLQLGAPRTSSFLAVPENAAVAHDDVENLSTFERLLKEQTPRALNLAFNAPNAVKSGLANMGLGVFEAYNAYEDFVVSSPLGKSLGADKLPTTFNRDKIRAAVEGYSESIRPKNMGFWDSAAYSGMESGAQSVAAILTPGGKEAALAKMLVPGAGNAYRRAIEEGLPPNKALLYAAGQTGIEGYTEVGPLFKLIEDIEIGTPLFKAFMRNFVSEQIGEQGATFFGDALDMVMLPSEKNKTIGEFMAERPEAALSTAIATLFGSATTVGTLKAVDYTAQKTMSMLDRQMEKAQQAETTKSYLDTMAQVAQASKLRERAPETFQQFVTEAAADGALTDVFVDKDVLQQALAETGIEAPADVAAQLTTLAPGSDVRVSIGDFATYLSVPEVYGKLADHLKTEPGGLTYAQSQEQAQEALDGLASTFDKALAVALTDEQFRASRDRVQEKFFAEQKAAGRFTDDVSNQYAFLNAQLVAVMANRVGMTPEELLARKPVSTRAGDSRAGKKVFAEDRTAEPSYDRGADPEGFREIAQRQVMAEQNYTEEDLADPEIKRTFAIQTQAKFDQLVESNYKALATGENSGQIGPRGNQTNASTVQDGRGVRGSTGLLDGQNRADIGIDQPLQGLPARIKVDGQTVTFGPYAPAREAARKYAERAGIDYQPVQTYQPVDPAFATRVAQAFEEMENNPTDPEVAAAYQAMIAETLAQWQVVKETGLVVEFIDGPDPYGNPRNAILDVVNNNHLWVYSTADGFGDGIGAADYDTTQQPMLAVVEGETISGKPVLVNDIFRIVHDYFGHIKDGVGFRADGEENAYRSHAAMYSPLARRAVATETRGQNSWVNFGPHAEFNKTASGADTRYAEQKIGLLPQWAVDGRRGDPEDGVLNQSAVTLRSGKETLKKYGLDPKLKHSTRDVAAALEARQREKWGSVDATDRSPAQIKKLANWMAEEVQFEMLHPQKSGVGWYSEKFQRALDQFGQEFPELLTDQDARDILTALIAITSDGQKVGPNFAQAADLYGNFKKTGTFSTTKGHVRQGSIDGNVVKIQELLQQMGAAGMREYLLQEDTVSNLKKVAKAQGLQFSTSYKADVRLPMAAVIFGPKLGAFYANLMGAHGYLTMDRWWSRTFNRYRGTLLQAPTKEGIARFRELIGRPEASNDEVIAATVEPRNAYAERGFKDGTEIEKAANTIWKAAFENIEDQPFNASDRSFMLETVDQAQKVLSRRGIGMSVADIQAVLWYYEKRLYGELGARQSADISYEEAAKQVVQTRMGSAAGRPAQGDDADTAINLVEGIPPGNEVFGLEQDEVLYQYDPGLSGFRSVLYETVRDKGSMKARASDWKSLLNNAPGVKKEEMEWMGLYDFLDIKGGGVEEGQNLPISKADVLAFIENNGVKLQEKMLSEDAEVDYYEDPRYLSIRDEVESELLEEEFNDNYVEPEWHASFGYVVDGRVLLGARPEADLGPPQPGDWDFDSTFVALPPEPELPPGPPNRELFPGADLGTAPVSKRNGSWYVIDWENPDYVEVDGVDVEAYELIKGPFENERDGREAMRTALRQHREEARQEFDFEDAYGRVDEQAEARFRDEYGSEERPKWGSYKVPGGDNYREMLINLEGDQNFTGSHWSEIPNVMAHARLTDRTDAEGRNVLYVEEIQSDWHQQGRTKGYEEKIDQAKSDELQEAWGEALETKNTVLDAARKSSDAFFKAAKDSGIQETFLRRLHELRVELDDLRQRRFQGQIEPNYYDEEMRLSEAIAKAGNVARPFKDYINFYDRGTYYWPKDEDWVPAINEIVLMPGFEDAFPSGFLASLWSTAREANEKVGEATLRERQANAAFRTYINQSGKIPDAPFKKSWPELVVKRLIAYAVENGYDRVALPDGNVIGSIVGAGDKASWFYEENLVNITNKLIKKSGQKLTLETLYTGDQRLRPDSRIQANYQGKIVEAKFFDINDALKSEVEMMGLPLFQGEARGTFNPSTGAITLNKTANLSTWLHELGHYQLELLADLATGPDAIPEIAADMDRVLAWFSELGGEVPMTIEQWNTLSLNEKRPYHEQFARGFEAYLFEGKAPSTELRGIFQRFRAWMLQVYRELKNLNVELNDEVRGVFDRMLASEDAITNAQEARGMEAAFANRPEGMTEAEWEAYQRIQQEATADAIDTLQTRSLRDMKWLSSQRSKVIRDLQRSAREMYKAMKAEVEAEVMQEPVYLAREYLKYGKLYGDEPSPDSRKLDIDALKAMFPESTGVDLTSLTRGGKYSLTQRDGAHPDVIAEMFGYESGDALVRALISAEPMNEKITGITDQRMLERHGDLTDQASIEAAADQIIHNDARARAVHTELSYAEKAQGKKTPVLQAARAFAENLVNRTILRNLRPDLAESAAERARRAAQTALKNDDLALFAAQKRNELVHVQSVRAQVKAKQELTSTMSFFARIITAKDEAVAKRRDLNLVMAARAVLAAHGIGRKSQNPQEYLDRVLAYDPEVGQQLKLDVAAATIGATGDFKDLTVEQMRGLRDVVNQLWDLAKTSKEMEVGGEKVALDDAVNQLVKELEDGPPPKYVGLGQDRAIDDRSLFLPGGGAGLPLLGIAALGRRVESWASAKGQAWSRFTFRVVSKAADQYRGALAVAVAQYRAILEPVAADMTRRKIDAPELNYTFGNDSTGIGMAELLGALRHTGNPSNLKKLLLGRGWADVAPDGSMDTTRWDAFIARMHREGVIQQRHWDFVQAEWDLHETLKPQAQKAHKTMYGRYFNEVTAAAVNTPFGAYRGGYVAAATDPNIVDDAALRKEAEEMFGGGSALFPAPANGFTKSRVEDYTRPLALNIGMAISQMDRVLRFAYLGPAVRDVNRLLRRPDLREVLKGYDPVAITDVLSPWLERSASQQVVTPPKGRAGRAVDAGMRLIRSRTSMALLFFNLSNTLQNFTGLGPASLRTGKRNLLEASMTYLRDPTGTAERIVAMSPMMAQRNNTQFDELQSEVRQIILKPNQYQKAQDWFAANAQWLQRGLQNVLDTMVWQAAYNRAVQEQDVDPIGFADSAVRETMGAFGAEDVARIETGSAVLRNFTLFFGYFNTQANLLGTEFSKAPTLGRALNVYTMGLLIPSLGAQMIAEAMRGNLFAGDDDEEKLMAMIQLFFTSQLSYLTAMFPGVGPAIVATVNSFDDKPFNDRLSLSPVISQVEAAIALPNALFELATTDEINSPKAIRDTATLVTLATGIPVSALARPVSYAVSVAEGDVEPTGPIDYARGLVTGVASQASKE